MRPLCLSALLVAGCVAPLEGPPGGSPPVGTPPGPAATTPPTSVTTPPCAAPPRTGPLSLAVAYTLPLDRVAWRVQAARILDGDGNGVVDAADPQQLWVQTETGHVLYEGTTPVHEVLTRVYLSEATLGDVDPAMPGSELAATWFTDGGPHRYSRHDGAGGEFVATVSASDGSSAPWLADLDGDGGVEAVTSGAVRDAGTGDLRASFPGGESDRTVSADLDLDGVQEVLRYDRRSGVQWFAPDGSLLATCAGPAAAWTVTSFAVGNLDDDPEGEVVAAGGGFAAVCDADGTVLAEVSLDTDQTAMVGLGELDGDPAPEIVIGDTTALVVLDDDLSTLFVRGEPGGRWAFYPFALADLDGDGYHEILVVDGEASEPGGPREQELLVLAGDGAVRGRVAVPEKGSWKGQPIVADLDADGLAEIAVAGLYGIAVVDDGALGGWDVPGADHPWAGLDRFPGDRDLLGGVPGPTTPWTTPETNVWQGLGTRGHPAASCP